MKNKIISLFIILILLLSISGCKKDNKEDKKQYYLNLVYFNDIGKKTIYYDENTVISKPNDPTKEGCIFSGWYYDINYTKPVTFPFTLTENTSIFAGWYSAFIYELDEITNTYGIKVGSYGEESVVIPSTYNDLPVTKILEYAFENRPNLKSITLPDTIIEIEDGAFGYCSKLKNINIPDSVKKIGKDVFAGCDELVYDNYNGLKYLGNWLIDARNVHMDRTNFKESTIGICNEAFYGNQNITEIVIPRGVTKIYSNTFKESSIKKLVIHENVKDIDLTSFEYTPNLEEIVVDENNKIYKTIDGVLFDKEVNTLLKYPSGKVSMFYSIPSTVTTIKEKAFRDSKSLYNINLSTSLISIEDFAFSGCNKLIEVIFNDKVEFIGFEAFRNCSSIKKLNLPGSVNTIKEGAIRYMNSLTELSLPFIANDDPLFNLAYLCGGEEYTIQKLESLYILGGNKIRNNSFKGLIEVTNLKLASTVSNIEEGAFSTIEKLFDISFPNGSNYYKVIDGAIYSSDESIVLTTFINGSPNTFYTRPNTKVIYKYAFNFNSSIKKIQLNDGLEDIHEHAFYKLDNLEELYIPTTVKTTGQDICFYTPKVTIYTRLLLRPDGWNEGWNTMYYPTIWNAHFPSFVNVELEKVIDINQTHVVTYTLEDAPDNIEVVLVSKNPEIVKVDRFTVTGLETGTAILELYIIGYEKYKCLITIHVGY